MAGVVCLRVVHRNAAEISAAGFIERDSVLRGIGDNPCREEALHQSCQQFRFRISSELEQRFDDGCNERDTTVLVRTFGLHNVQDLGQPSCRTDRLHSLPFGDVIPPLMRICVADVVGHDHAAAVHFHTIIDFVPGVGVCALGIAQAIQHTAEIIRGGHTVSLHQMQPQPVGVQLVRVTNFHHGEHITAHKPAFQGQLLQAVEIVQPHGITTAAVFGPKPELCLGFTLPLFGFFRG